MPIDPSAYVDKTAIIADSADIGPRAYVGKHCVIGENVKIGINAIVECHTEIGEGTVLSPNAYIGGAPQDYSFKNEDTKLIIGKNCIIREFAPIHRATTKENWKTVIGDNCYIMALAHIGHDCVLGNSVTISSSAMIAGHVHIDDFALVSGFAGIHQFVRLGTMSMIAGISHVGRDVPPYCIACCAEKSKLEGLNIIGMQRRGVSSEARLEIKRAFKIWTDRALLAKDAIEQLKDLQQYPEVAKFVEFVSYDSKRGVVRLI